MQPQNEPSEPIYLQVKIALYEALWQARPLSYLVFVRVAGRLELWRAREDVRQDLHRISQRSHC